MYDTSTAGSRPVHVNTLYYSKQPILDYGHYPYSSALSNSNPLPHTNPKASSSIKNDTKMKLVLEELFPKRLLVIRATDQTIRDVPAHRVAPLAVSHRTGQVVHTLGRSLFVTSAGAATSSSGCEDNQDVSMVMMRRARCLHVVKYSMDADANIELLTTEHEQIGRNVTSSPSATVAQLSIARVHLIRLWKWIQRAELMCEEAAVVATTGSNADEFNSLTLSSPMGGEPTLVSDAYWPAKSLLDAGVLQLLQLDDGKPDANGYSDSLCCATYESEGRR